MRWVPFAIFSYLFIVLQCSLNRILMIDSLPMGPFGPDLVIILALFIALNVGDLIEGMVAGWILGMLMDLTTSGFDGRLGLMGIFIALCVWMVHGAREALFRERALPQMLIAGVFVLVAHGLWITLQSIISFGMISWATYGSMLLQVLMTALYTSLLTPLVIVALRPATRWLMELPSSSRSTRVWR